jgi:hypothetical protein
VSDEPVYVSGSSFKSIWQEYRIYGDRLEFETKFGQMIVPFENIDGFEVLDADTKALLRGDLRLKNFRPAIKIDWANFMEHVVLDKKEGCVRRILFTPEDPLAFKDALQGALSSFQEAQGGSKA